MASFDATLTMLLIVHCHCAFDDHLCGNLKHQGKPLPNVRTNLTKHSICPFDSDVVKVRTKNHSDVCQVINRTTSEFLINRPNHWNKLVGGLNIELWFGRCQGPNQDSFGRLIVNYNNSDIPEPNTRLWVGSDVRTNVRTSER